MIAHTDKRALARSLFLSLFLSLFHSSLFLSISLSVSFINSFILLLFHSFIHCILFFKTRALRCHPLLAYAIPQFLETYAAVADAT